MKEHQCAYCGKPTTILENEHVFPKCLYPPSKSNSRVQRLTIPSCKYCNNGWSNDEAHFRNMLMLAGESNPTRQELWETGSALRSFDEVDGQQRLNDLFIQMKPTKMADGSIRQMIFPGNDDRVVRVVKKVVRGLSYHHDVLWPISERRVWVDVLKYVVPKEILDRMEYHHREEDIAEYKYEVLNDSEINSVWLITFFQRVTFIGLVSISESGFT